MFVSAGEQGWGKGPGKLPSPRLWVPGEGEVDPRLNLASAAVRSGGAPRAGGSGQGGEGGQTATRAGTWGQGQARTPSPATVSSCRVPLLC